MTATSILVSSGHSRGRKFRNLVATVLISLAFLAALIPLVFIVLYVIQRGSEALDWDFLTKPIPFSERIEGPGMGPAVAGTLVITGAAALMAIPLGVLGGIYL